MAAVARGIPVVEPFEIPALGWRFVDRRTISARARNVVEIRWMTNASRWLQSQGIDPRGVICGLDPTEHESQLALFQTALESEPGLVFEEFIATGGAITRPIQCDPRLPDVFLGIRSARRWLGGVSITNIEVEGRTPNAIKVSTQMLLGVPVVDGSNTPHVWRRVYRYMMRNPLMLVGGRRLDIVEYRSNPSIRTLAGDQVEVEEFIGLMESEFVTEGDTSNRDERIRFRRSRRSRDGRR